MAELPEIVKLSAQMRERLAGKTIRTVELSQEKCSNVTREALNARAAGAKIADIFHKGKWIFTRLDNGEHVLLSLGMGADVLYLPRGGARPEKYQVRLETEDGDGYTIRFWWFGHYRLVPDAALADEPGTRGIAMDPFDARFTPEYFAALLRGKKTGVKAFLLDQKNVSGIGNMYMHDILFRARLHPLRKVSALSDGDAAALYAGVLDTLNEARARGAFCYEMDFYGEKGRFGMGDFLVGYREGAPCPVCGAAIETVKTGSTSSYICPACQK